MAEQTPYSAESDAFVPGDALKNVDILYVDDDSQRRDSMRRMLQGLLPRSVHVAENGLEALKLINGAKYGLIVCENDLAKTDGIEFVREVRLAAYYPRAVTPILLIGRPASADVIKAALAAGANSFMIKPFASAKLYERLLLVLNDSRPFVIKDGRYVIKPAKVVLPAGVGTPARA